MSEQPRHDSIACKHLQLLQRHEPLSGFREQSICFLDSNLCILNHCWIPQQSGRQLLDRSDVFLWRGCHLLTQSHSSLARCTSCSFVRTRGGPIPVTDAFTASSVELRKHFRNVVRPVVRAGYVTLTVTIRPRTGARCYVLIRSFKVEFTRLSPQWLSWDVSSRSPLRIRIYSRNVFDALPWTRKRSWLKLLSSTVSRHEGRSPTTLTHPSLNQRWDQPRALLTTRVAEHHPKRIGNASSARFMGRQDNDASHWANSLPIHTYASLFPSSDSSSTSEDELGTRQTESSRRRPWSTNLCVSVCVFCIWEICILLKRWLTDFTCFLYTKSFILLRENEIENVPHSAACVHDPHPFNSSQFTVPSSLTPPRSWTCDFVTVTKIESVIKIENEGRSLVFVIFLNFFNFFWESLFTPSFLGFDISLDV